MATINNTPLFASSFQSINTPSSIHIFHLSLKFIPGLFFQGMLVEIPYFSTLVDLPFKATLLSMTYQMQPGSPCLWFHLSYSLPQSSQYLPIQKKRHSNLFLPYLTSLPPWLLLYNLLTFPFISGALLTMSQKVIHLSSRLKLLIRSCQR